MLLGIDFFDYPYQYSGLIEDEGLSYGAHRRLAVHLLFAPCSECLKDFCRGIGKKGL